MIESIEQAIVSMLSQSVADADIRVFPGNAEEYKRVPLNKPRIFVGYAGSSYSEPTNCDAIIQERTLSFEITFQVRNLRDHEGVYDYLASVYSALTGFSPLNDKRAMHAVEERLVNFENNVWTWTQTWEIKERQTV